jgi:hypothetical protein
MKPNVRKAAEGHRPKSVDRGGAATLRAGNRRQRLTVRSPGGGRKSQRLTNTALALHTTHLGLVTEPEKPGTAGELRAESDESRPPDEERTAVMSNFVKLANEAGDQYLAALAESQEQLLNYMKAFAAWTPAVSPMPMPPLAQDYFPTPREVLEANFSFAAKLLKQQKAFADKLFAAGTPVG